MFITFEGLDFSGKSTQVELFTDRLTREQHKLLVLRDPGGTAIGEKIRSILLDKRSLGMADMTELFLFSASRSQLVYEVIQPALERGVIVVCDRFYDSTTAYQGWGRNISLDAIRAINSAATSGLVPDITYFLDIPPVEIRKRMEEKNSLADRMESSGLAFYERVRDGYLRLAREEHQRFEILDGLRPIEEIHALVWERFLQEFGRRGQSRR